MARKINNPVLKQAGLPVKLATALREYQQKDRRGKFVFTVPQIAARAGLSPVDLVKLAIKCGLEQRVIVRSDMVIRAALLDYVNHPEEFTKDIAKRHGVSAATLTVWATNAGIPLRSRGVRKRDQPTARQREILELAAIYPYEKVGQRFGVTKARVGALVKRWKHWKVPVQPPFQPGDIILWRNKGSQERLTVIEAGLTQGTMLDAKGRLLRAFTWNSGGRLPKKIGVDPKYVAHAKTPA